MPRRALFYCIAIAPTGQTPTHAEHPIQDAPTTAFPPSIAIVETGQTPVQAVQPIQDSFTNAFIVIISFLNVGADNL